MLGHQRSCHWSDFRFRLSLRHRRNESMPISFFASVFAALLFKQPAASTSPSLDYEFFKARVQPIFTTKRDGNARCVSCHSSGTPMRLQPLAAANATWNEDDS